VLYPYCTGVVSKKRQAAGVALLSIPPLTLLWPTSQLATRTSPGTPSHLILNQASFRTDAGKRSAYLATWMQRGMKVLTRPARTRPVARFVGLVRHSSRAAGATMALKFPVYPPARYAGESVPVKRPKVRMMECEHVCVGLRC
jgi:hypothetical protein